MASKISKYRLYRNILPYLIGDLTGCARHRWQKTAYSGPVSRILVVNFQGIGNMILFTPVLESIKKAYPEAEVVLVVAERGTKEVISGSGLVNRIIEYDAAKDAGRHRLGEIIAELRNEPIDIGICASRDSLEPYLLYEAKAMFRIGFKYRVGSYKNAAFLLHAAVEQDYEKHEVINDLNLLKPLEIKIDAKAPIFHFDASDMATALGKLNRSGIRFSEQAIGFHVGSYGNMAQKRWLPQNFARLGDRLHATYASRIFLFGGREEKKIASLVIQKMTHPAFNLAGQLTLKETAAIISRLRLFVSNDSGLMHVAAAVGTPVIGLFGPTVEKKNAPWSWDGVPAVVVRHPMACAPCYNPYGGHINCEHVNCLRELTPDMVMVACQDILDGQHQQTAR